MPRTTNVDAEGLTAREAIFVNAYLGNATEAAKAAGYKTPSSESKRLMKRPQVMAAIACRAKETAKRSTMTRDRWIQLLVQIAENPEDQTVQLKSLAQLGRANAWDKQSDASNVVVPMVIFGAPSRSEKPTAPGS